MLAVISAALMPVGSTVQYPAGMGGALIEAGVSSRCPGLDQSTVLMFCNAAAVRIEWALYSGIGEGLGTVSHVPPWDS